MTHNSPEVEWEHDYFTNYPYAVEVFYGDTCEDVYRTNSLSNAQAKFDKWSHDLSVVNGHSVVLLKYNENLGEHFEIDYNGNEV